MSNKSQKLNRNLIIFLLLLLGLGAIYGGVTMIISPSGEMLGIPLSMLEPSPFNNFLIPGIILFVFLGVLPLVVTHGLIKMSECKFLNIFNKFRDMHWAWTYTIYIGFILIIWIQVEMVLINSVHWSHTIYIFLALIIIFLALTPTVRNTYKKS